MKIFAVIVTYNPNIELLKSMLNSILNQVEECVIVDNGSSNFPEITNDVHIIKLEKNSGIAYAQNRGIEYALSKNADWILFSDQDTIYPSDFIEKMFSEMTKITDSKIGAIVPVFFDEVKNKLSEIMITKTQKIIPEPNNIYKISHSISSGTIVPVNVIKECGDYKEELFIDFVDFEWCWRITEAGYSIYCLSDIKINHKLGDCAVTKFGMKIVSRNIMRFYYIIRNGFYLLSEKYLYGKDRLMFNLLMAKKIMEAVIIHGFNKKTLFIISKAVKYGKKGELVNYDEL